MKILTIFLIFSIGCSKTMYIHPSKNSIDFERDKYDCKHSAVAHASHLGMQGNVFIIWDEIIQCIKLKHGWTEHTNSEEIKVKEIKVKEIKVKEIKLECQHTTPTCNCRSVSGGGTKCT